MARRNGGNLGLVYPGLEFGMETDEGKALLGTPNGRGTAWIVMDHLGEMGRRRFRCRVWRVQVGVWVMVWRMDDY